MGKFLKVLGGLFLGLVVVVLGLFVFALTGGKELDSSSKAYVDATIPILATNWNPEDLKSRSSKELLVYLNDPKFDQVYVMMRRLGPIVNYKESKGQAHTNLNLSGMQTTASYIATADFQNGPGTIKMSLIRKNKQWEILEFRVDSPIFLKQ